MQSNQPQVKDLGRAFRNMCHAVAIATASNARETVERLLIRIILQAPQPYSDPAEFQRLLITQFGVDVPIEMVNSALDSLESSGRVNRRDGTYLLTPDVAAAQQKAAQDILDLERRVLDEWHSEVMAEADEADVYSYLDDALHSLLTRVLRRHGVQTVEIIHPSARFSVDDDLTLIELIRKEAESVGSGVDTNRVEHALRAFFEGAVSSPDRLSYIAMLADTAFAYYALSVPPEAAEAFKARMSNITILFDTNALFGITDLNPDIRDAVKRVARQAVQNGLPMKLRYTPQTLDEFNHTVIRLASVLEGPYSATTSHALLTHGLFENVVQRRYHELNSEAKITVTDYRERLQKLQHSFEKWELRIFREDWVSEKYVEEVTQEYASYLDDLYSSRRTFEDQRKSARNIEHDAYLLAVIYEIRNKSQRSDSVGALLLTLDSTLMMFDRNLQEQQNTTGTTIERRVVGPDTLLQLLRHFTPAEARSAYDSEFARAISTPAFRVQTGSAARAAQEIAQVMSRYEDLPGEVAERVLANDALLQKVVQGASEEELDAAVNSVLVSEFKEMQERLRDSEGKNQDLLERVLQLEAQVAYTESPGATLANAPTDLIVSQEMAEQAPGKQSIASATGTPGSEMERLKAQNKRLIRQVTAVVCALVGLVIGYGAWYFHPLVEAKLLIDINRVQAALSTGVIGAAIIAAARDSFFRVWGFGVIGGTVLINAVVFFSSVIAKWSESAGQ